LTTKDVMAALNRKLALGIGSVSLAIAFVLSTVAWWMSREQAEETIVAMAVQESRALFSQDEFRPEGEQASVRAIEASRILIVGLFDRVEISTPQGELLAQAITAAGRSIQNELLTPVRSNDLQPYYERQRLPSKRFVLRIHVPVPSSAQTISAHLLGIRLIPPWQEEQIRADAFKTALLTALAVLLCGAAMYPMALSLTARQERKARDLLESHIAMMEAMGRAIARKDSDTGTHNYRVAWIAATLAQAVGLHGVRMQELIAGSFLHDVGKIGIPDAILLKPDRLDESEMAIMKTHVELGEAIVSGPGWLAGGATVVAAHHEKWDGSGYPRGLQGEDIALVARIFAIADVFDALCSRRPFKEPKGFDEAIQILHEGAGTHFDPHLIKVFSSLAEPIYQTVLQATEAELRALLSVMVHKHFAL
jgi:HD-GYP domain-containing protein (c-di-GMP phosphodiesterase class II)